MYMQLQISILWQKIQYFNCVEEHRNGLKYELFRIKHAQNDLSCLTISFPTLILKAVNRKGFCVLAYLTEGAQRTVLLLSSSLLFKCALGKHDEKSRE